jgi:hypothetical protein
MKLAAPNRRQFRKPPRLQQESGFLAKEDENAAFFQPRSEARMKEDSFFAANMKAEPQPKQPQEEEAPV